jgi:glycosyltransferase involved in cell wall biosynthesis
MSWKALTHRTPRIIAVIPAFNEECRVGRVIQKIPKDAVDEILVVDDHSGDSTARESVLAGASVISHDGPRGAGAAIKAGYVEGLRRGGNILVVLAGDMQHDPSEIPRLLEVVEEGNADYVVGDRLSGDPVAHGMPPLRYVGNVVLTFLTRLITRVDVKDSQCGYTAITSQALERIDMEWLSESWGITNGLLAECRRNQIRVKSVPVSTCYGARASYIRFPTYVPCMLMVLLRAFFRIARQGTVSGDRRG